MLLQAAGIGPGMRVLDLGSSAGDVLPVMERTGVATADQVRPDTLERRLAEEAMAYDAMSCFPPLISARATV
ncbi:hypothetical protein J5X84_19830 [Streptosporangiaceae bacterium NEAU-GS5]|nr:hypothetical protein [Streptosporangiaceae bacterium NEAU-GS5]